MENAHTLTQQGTPKKTFGDLISQCIISTASITLTFVATNTVRVQVFASMSAHLMILGLIL